jgi:CRISPR-associated exonuclease Cas4
LVKSYAKILKEEREKASQNIDAHNKNVRQKSDSTYFLYEEPELYLHPHAEKELYSSLKELSISDKNQVILTTHSASFIDIENYKSIAIVKKENLETGTKILQCSSDLFENNLKDKKRFNLIYWINTERSEIFFAKKVILLEGQTDKVVIPYIAKELNIFKYEYSLIDCAGKGSIPLYITLLNNFKIPYMVVYDQDFQAYKNIDGHNKARTETQAILDKIDSTLGQYTVFENDIEEELGILDKTKKDRVKSNPFLILEQIENREIALTDRFKAKIKQIYA